MRIAIVQPPRLYWAFINDYDNFMVPQAPPALAAVARCGGSGPTWSRRARTTRSTRTRS
jgi:hypothetical protein